MVSPDIEIGPRSAFNNSAVGGKVASGGGSAHDLTPLVPDIVGRGAWGETESKGANHLSRVPESGWALPLSASIRRPDRGKTS